MKIAQKKYRALGLSLGLALITTLISAQEPKLPKASVELGQKFESEFIAGSVAASDLTSADALGASFDIKAAVTYDLGGTVKISPYIKDNFALKLNPTGAAALGSDRARNRLSLGLDTAFDFDPAFNLGLGFEYRLGSDLSNSNTKVLPEHRLTPTLQAKGKVDVVYYSLAQQLHIVLDASENTTNDLFLTQEAAYNLGIGIKLSDRETLKFDFSDKWELGYRSQEKLGTAETFFNTFSARVILASPELSPSLGFFWYQRSNFDINGANPTVVQNIPGLVLGADFNKDNMTLSGSFMVGPNTADGKDDRIESHASVMLKFKL